MSRFYFSLGCGSNKKKYYLNDNNIKGLMIQQKGNLGNYIEYIHFDELSCPDRFSKYCMNCLVCEFFKRCREESK